MSDPAELEDLYKRGELKRPTAALTELLNNPEKFLKTYPLSIDEHPGPSGVRTAYIGNGKVAKRPGTVLKTLRMHRTEAFEISLIKAYGHSFPCQYVRMVPSNQDVDWYTLQAMPTIMLTCKLTGCSFVVRENADGSIQVAHLQPKDETGIDLNKRLRVKGQVAYGRLSYNFESRQVSIVGVRSARGWQVFAQKVDKEKEVGIRSVHRIFPA